MSGELPMPSFLNSGRRDFVEAPACYFTEPPAGAHTVADDHPSNRFAILLLL